MNKQVIAIVGCIVGIISLGVGFYTLWQRGVSGTAFSPGAGHRSHCDTYCELAEGTLSEVRGEFNTGVYDSSAGASTTVTCICSIGVE